MKIGLSLSRCVRDIFEKKVDIDDVLVIIARTDFDVNNDEHWANIWQGYAHGSSYCHREWEDYTFNEAEFREIVKELHETGKLHQPRQYGAFTTRLPYYWMEVVVADEDLENKPAVKRAWENYQLIAGLS